MFGTDGIRGQFGYEPLTLATLTRIGFHAGLTAKKKSGCVLIGRDTRSSSDLIMSQLSAGVMASGVDVIDAGVLPTPITSKLPSLMGSLASVAVIIQITASHNPSTDNGLKFMWSNGEKWQYDFQREFVSQLTQGADLSIRPGSMRNLPQPALDAMLSDYEANTLEGLRVVIDAAHGAYSPFVVDIMRHLGAEALFIGNDPDGYNINDGVGATAPAALCDKVLAVNADVGIALDGDGDRLIMVTPDGCILDGDDIIWILLQYHKHLGEEVSSIVLTPMSNQGLIDHCDSLGVKTHVVPVGDQNIVAELRRLGERYGVEPSGHVVDLDHGFVCDGLLTAVRVIMAQRQLGKSLEACKLNNRYAQVMRSIRYDSKYKSKVVDIIESTKWTYHHCRINVRLSGTEPVIRVMVESSEESEAQNIAQAIVDRLNVDLQAV